MVGVVAPFASAQYFDDFDIDSSANWTTNKSHTNTHASTYAYDYSALGIASAPGSAGGTTKGLRLQANLADGISTSGLSVSPNGFGVSTDFVMTADVYMSYIASGSGSTQLGFIGWGTTGTTAQWLGQSASTRDSVFFGATPDGGSSADYRAYSNTAAGLASYTDAATSNGNPVYFAGSRNSSNAYYTTAFPSHAIPAPQSGTVPAGAVGHAWRVWRLERAGNDLTFRIDGNLIATVSLLEAGLTTSSQGNILLGLCDTNAGVAVDPSGFNSMIVDNVRVQAVPEPGTMAVLGLGIAALLRKRRK